MQMHCPQCGQEQVSSEMRFCKSCGFSLDGVRELLATPSISPAKEKTNLKSRQSPRRKGVRHGVILLFISMVFMPLINLIGKPQGEFLPMIFLMAGLMRILYAVIFQEGAPRKKKQDSSLPYVAPVTTDQLGTEARGSALPPSRSVPVSAFSARGMDTSEMVSTPSVTEHTTKLLDESPNPK
jgi:zinc-ribbon domain